MSGQTELSEKEGKELYIAEKWDVDVDAIRGAQLSDIRITQVFQRASNLYHARNGVLGLLAAGAIATIGLLVAATTGDSEPLKQAAIWTGLATFFLGGGALEAVTDKGKKAAKEFEAELERKTPSAVSEKNVISPP